MTTQLPSATLAYDPAGTGASGSSRLTFIGFDLAGNSAATAVLKEMAQVSGGRLLQADAKGELAVMLQAGVTAAVGSGGGGPYVVRNASSRSPLVLAVGMAVAVNLMLLVALVVLRSPVLRSRAASLLRRGGRTVGLTIVGGMFLLSATPARAGIASAKVQPLLASTAAAPVLLIPGIFGSAETFDVLAMNLATRGWRELPVFTFAAGVAAPSCIPQVAGGLTGSTGGASCVPWDALAVRAVQTAPAGSRFLLRMEMADNARLSFADQGERVRIAVSALRRITGAAQVRIAGHSMGGLAARAYLQGRRYDGDVEELITIATPHGGSLLPYAQQIYSGEIPDLTAPLPSDQFRSHVITSSFDDAAGTRVDVDIPGPLADDRGLGRLISERTAFGIGFNKTLHDPARRREAYNRVLQELATMSRVRANASWLAGRLQRAGASVGLAASDVEHLLTAVERAAIAMDKRYVPGGTLSGNLRNAFAQAGRQLSTPKAHRALGNASVALAGVGTATAISDVVAGALLLQALATDEAFERLEAIRSTLAIQMPGDVPGDTVLDNAFNDAIDGLHEAQSLMGALVQETETNAGKLGASAVNLGAAIGAHTSTVLAKAAPIVLAALVTRDLLAAVSAQWELAQEATLMATLALRLQGRGDQADERTVAYAQRAFFEMMAEALGGRLGLLNDLGRFGRVSRETVAMYRKEASRLRRLGPVDAPCVRPTDAYSLLRVALPVAGVRGMDVSAPTVRRLAPDAPELRALNAPGMGAEFGPLPASLRYVTVIADAGDAPPVQRCALSHWRAVFEGSLSALSAVVQTAGATQYRFDASQVPMSSAFVLSRTDLVVPVPLQSLSAVRAGWTLQPQVEIVQAHHLSVNNDPKVLELIDRQLPPVATGPAGPGIGVDRVLLVQDLSGSMLGRKLEEARDALRTAIAAAPTNAEFSLHVFGEKNCETREVVPFTADRTRLDEAIRDMRGDGLTPLFEAMQQAARVVRESAAPERMAVVVVTDGAPNCGAHRFSPADVAREMGMALRLVR